MEFVIVMPNKYYNRSKRKEQELVREAKKLGHIAIRSAGSKSPIDVVDIDHVNRIIHLIQVKTGNVTDAQFRKLHKEFNHLNGNYLVNYEIWYSP